MHTEGNATDFEREVKHIIHCSMSGFNLSHVLPRIVQGYSIDSQSWHRAPNRGTVNGLVSRLNSFSVWNNRRFFESKTPISIVPAAVYPCTISNGLLRCISLSRSVQWLFQPIRVICESDHVIKRSNYKSIKGVPLERLQQSWLEIY